MLKEVKTNKGGGDMDQKQRLEWEKKDRAEILAHTAKCAEIARKWSLAADKATTEADFIELARLAKSDGPSAERVVAARAGLARAQSLRKVLGGGR